MKKYKRMLAVILMVSLFGGIQDYTEVFAEEAGNDIEVSQPTAVPELTDMPQSTMEASETVAPTSTMVAKEGPFVAFEKLIMPMGTKEKIQWMNKAEDAVITYVVENEELLYVDVDGMLYSKGKEGTTVVRTTVMQNGSTYQGEFTVEIAGYTETGFSYLENDIFMGKGDIYQLDPKLVPEDAKDIVSYTVSGGAVSGAAIVTVDKDGIIQALDYGTAEIIVSLENGAYYVVNVRVGVLVDEISFKYLAKKKTITLAEKQSRTLSVTISPSDAAKKELDWKSSDPEIATVTKKGKVTAKKVGTTTITVSTTDGSNLSLKMTVKVKKREEGTNYTEKGLSIVSTDHSKYTYKEMQSDLKKLKSKYREYMTYEELGRSYDNRRIYQIKLGNPKAKKVVLVQASIHAREYMTAQLVMKQVEFYCANYFTGTYNGKYYSELFDDVCFLIIPMSNPDGVTISQYGPVGLRNATYRNKVKKIGKKYGKGRRSYYTTWKANARGVDLNRNFDGHWDLFKPSTTTPRADGYKGKSPGSEKESKVLIKTAKDNKPTAVISYHAMGQILYWNFGQKGEAKTKELKLLNKIKGVTGYSPVKGYSKYHSTGYGDWIAIKRKKPTVTIEIGSSACPLPKSQFPSVWSKNKQVLAATAELYD